MNKDKMDKVLSIGIKKENNLDEYEALEVLLKILNKTVFRKTQLHISELDSNYLEDWLRKVDKRYGLYVSYILTVRTEEKLEMRYSMMIKNKAGEHVTTVFCRTILEGLCKVCIYLYEYIKGGQK